MNIPRLFISALCFLCFTNSNYTQHVKLDPIELENTRWKKFIEALIYVESGGDPYAVGKTDDAGILQITPIYVEEVNRILGKNTFTLEDRFNTKRSLEMFDIYQQYYNPDREIEKAIRLHNPGAGSWYKERVLKAMK